MSFMNNTSIQNLKPGTIVNSGKNVYTIKSVLGNGAFGITYHATGLIRIGNVRFEVPFAIKEHFMQSCFRDKDGTRVLCTPGSKDDVNLSRKDFLTEAKRLQLLCNTTRYIVKVNEAFEANGTAYYVMEYLSGGSLKAKSKQQAIDYMLNISEAVQVLHGNRMLHMDIKPSNVILKVDEDTNELYPVLIDFGITRHFDDKGKPTTASLTKGVSMGYAPIEQYDEVTTFSPTIDIYAMGATLYYLLTERNPPDAFKLCNDFKPIRETLSKACCDEFIPFITKAMAANYKDRYSNAQAFIRDLKNITLSNDDFQRDTDGADSSAKNGLPPTSRIKKNEYSAFFSSKTLTAPLYKYVYTFNERLGHIYNSDIEGVIQTIIIAQETKSNLFGIIDGSNNNVIVPFIYMSIGRFEKIPAVRGSDFTFGWLLVAPFQKRQDGDSYKGGLEITSNGNIVESFFPEDTQAHFPNEPRTCEIICRQTFDVNGKKVSITIQQNPWEYLGIVDTEGNVIAPYIYDSIEPFSEHCMIPGPGIPQMFLGAKYTIGNDIGFLKITENGILVDYKRFSLETYRKLSSLT